MICKPGDEPTVNTPDAAVKLSAGRRCRAIPALIHQAHACSNPEIQVAFLNHGIIKAQWDFFYLPPLYSGSACSAAIIDLLPTAVEAAGDTDPCP